MSAADLLDGIEPPRLPDEVWNIVASFLSLRDLVAMCMVNHQMLHVTRSHPTTDKTPIFTDQGFTNQARIREAWKHLPFGMDTAKMVCATTVFTGHRGPIYKIMEAGEWVLTCSDDGSFKVWEQQDWTCARTVEAGERGIWSMVECDGRLVTGGSDGLIKLWDMDSWTCAHTIHGENAVRDLVVQGDKYLLSCGDDKIVRVWDRTSWECCRNVPTGNTGGFLGMTLSLAVHSGNVYCAGGIGDPTIRVIDTTTWTGAGLMEGHTHWANHLLVWEDKLVSCSSDYTIKVWDLGEGLTCQQTLDDHTAAVYTVAVCGDKLVSGGDDETLRVWRMRRGPGAWECERVLRGHETEVRAVACTRDGLRLLSCDTGGSMRIWEEEP